MEFTYTPGISDNRIDLEKGEIHELHIPINLNLDSDKFENDLLLPE